MWSGNSHAIMNAMGGGCSGLALIMLLNDLAAITGKDMISTTQMSDRFSLGFDGDL